MYCTHHRLIATQDFVKHQNQEPNTKTSKYVLCSQSVGSKNGNMVLHLVLPNGSNQQKLDNHHNHSPTSGTSYEDAASPGEKYKRKHDDFYSTINVDCNVNQGYVNDLCDDFDQNYCTISNGSIPQTQISEENQQKSTSIDEKNRKFRKTLTSILSTMYALFIISLGLIIYISDIVVGTSPLAETFSLYLVIISLIFILYLIIDISIYMKKKNIYNNLEKIDEQIEMKESPIRELQMNITVPEVTVIKQLEHHYCLNKNRHSSNFYLKVGAAGFCLGHLIHCGLLVGYQIIFLTNDGDVFYECATISGIVLDIVYPIYSFFLLYFIFKYSNVVINRQSALARFGLMHCLSSSLCFWLWTIIRETIESLSNHEYEEEEVRNFEKNKISEVAFFVSQPPIALPLTSYSKRGAKLLTDYVNNSIKSFNDQCFGDKKLRDIYQHYSPYLYPFSVEYSILVVGVLFVIWQSIGRCKEEISDSRQCDSPEGNSDNLESNIVIHADCHSANKGLFGGIVIIVIAVVSIILFFVAINDDSYISLGLFVNKLTSIIIVFLMTVTGIFAYRQITKLDVNNGHISLLDDLLLFVCIPAFFFNGVFTIIPAVLSESVVGVLLVILEVTQVLVQTPLIIDGLRRCSNSRELRRGKPGRELLTFLIVCNVAMWITQTFEVKSHGLQDHDFYGKELWTIIGHMCIPLMMFYRFHSSVCIVDIWKYAYEPSNN